MESAGHEEAVPGSGPAPRRSSWWAWPVILISAAAIALAPNLLPRAEEVTDLEEKASGLVVMQIQSRIIVAAAAFDRGEARKSLDQLRPMATTDTTAAALAALHVFFDRDGGGIREAGAILDSRLESAEANAEFLGRIRQALEQGIRDEERESLRPRLGGFADFLPAEGRPLSWPREEEIRSRSQVTLISVAAMVVGGLLGGGTGLVFLLVGLVKMTNGTLSRAEPFTAPSVRGVFLESFAIFMALLFLAQAAGWFLHWSLQFLLFAAAVLIVLVWPNWRARIAWSDVRRLLGLHRGRGWIREIFAGIAGYLMILPLAAVGLIFTLILSGLAGAMKGGPVEPPSHPVVGMMEGGWPAFILIFVVAAIVAPITEEITFRGAFYTAVRSKWGFLASALVTSFLFAVIHPQGIFAVPALMAVGFGLAMTREWRGSLIGPMVAHGVNNAILLGMAFLMLS